MAITNHTQAQAAVANALAILSTEKQQADQTTSPQTDAQIGAVFELAVRLDQTTPRS